MSPTGFITLVGEQRIGTAKRHVYLHLFGTETAFITPDAHFAANSAGA